MKSLLIKISVKSLIAARTHMHNPSAALQKLSIIKKNEIESHNGSFRVFFLYSRLHLIRKN